jgi:phosphatidate cytidylyltransferase
VSELGGRNPWSDLGIRTAAALVLAPLALVAIYLGGAWFAIFLALMGLLMALEYVAIVHQASQRQFALHATAVLAALFLPQAGKHWETLAAIVILAGLSIFLASRERGGKLSFWRVVGVPYVALPTAALGLLRSGADGGLEAVLWLALVVWATDIGAYFAGRLIGGPKLAPRLSPKKTWAGLVGGMVAAILASAGFCSFKGLDVQMPAVLAAVLACVAQAGDIFESALKRRHDVKDSSALIPGHGGVLDRVDGLMAAAVVAAALGLWRFPDAVGQGLLFW